MPHNGNDPVRADPNLGSTQNRVEPGFRQKVSAADVPYTDQGFIKTSLKILRGVMNVMRVFCVRSGPYEPNSSALTGVNENFISNAVYSFSDKMPPGYQF